MDEKLILLFLSGECSNQELEEIAEKILIDESFSVKLFEMERLWLLKKEVEYTKPILLDDAFIRFRNNIDKNTHSNKIHRKPFMFLHRLNYAVAVVLIAILSVGLSQLFTKNSSGNNKLEAAYSQQAKLTLSDGTTVWLNSGSTLIYPSKFDKKSRLVELTGEAYFDVAKNQSKPFIVSVHDIDIRVLGTSFNVKCYNNEETSVVLKEGQVELISKDLSHKMILNPDEKVIYSEEKFHLIKNVDVDNTLAWLKDELKFEDELLTSIVSTLRRKYNVYIYISNLKLHDSRFTCRVQANATLKQVLELLESTREINYKIENGEVEIF